MMKPVTKDTPMAMTDAQRAARYRAKRKAAHDAAQGPENHTARRLVAEELAQYGEVSPAYQAMAMALAGVLDQHSPRGKTAAAHELRRLLATLHRPTINPVEQLATILAKAMATT